MTIAQDVAEKGVKALDAASTERLNEAKLMVEAQQKALDEVGPVLRKLADEDDLTRMERSVLVDHRIDVDEFLREEQNDAEKEAEIPRPSIEDRLKRFLRPPQAHFYVQGKDDSLLVVHVVSGEAVKLIADTDPDFF